MSHSEEKKQASTGAIFREYWSHTKAHWPWVAATFFLMLCNQVADIIAPLYLKQFFNTLSVATPSPSVAGALFVTVVFVAAAWLVSWACRNSMFITISQLEIRVMSRIGNDTFARLIRHSHDFFASNFSGALTHKANKFVKSYEQLVDGIFMTYLPAFFFIIGAIVVLSLRNPTIGIALAIWVVMMISTQLFLSRKNAPLRSARSAAETKVTATLADAISNHSAIQLFSAREYEQSLVSTVTESWRAITLRQWTFYSFILATIGFFTIVIQIIMLTLSVRFWLAGTFTVGDFVLVQLYLFTTFDRVMSINNRMRGTQDALSDSGEMVAILQTPYSVQDVAGAPTLAVKESDIHFDQVQFHFDEKNPVLKNLSLAIQPGEKVALVGPSGAGKSTITKLLLRLYDVTSGAVTIGGTNIAHVTQESLRENIGYVPQEPVLFHRTLKDNIRYGKRDATDEEVMEAAKQAHCHEFISRLTHGYDTLVGERGIKLSGGERQRVAIARAILKNAPILVLDEATSALDSESEMLIQDALATLMHGKTVVVIAHRLSTIMHMDRIIVLDGGTVVDTGTHHELLKKDGLYKKLWDIQVGGYIGGEEEEDPTPLA